VLQFLCIETDLRYLNDFIGTKQFVCLNSSQVRLVELAIIDFPFFFILTLLSKNSVLNSYGKPNSPDPKDGIL
jgi:hypothetical protein